MSFGRIFNAIRPLSVALCRTFAGTKPTVLNGARAETSSTTPTTSAQQILMQFFDEKKNWSETEIKVGRSWKKDELRIKSNVDLHKLWYVLLKERNMLYTMERECDHQYKLFPNPERIDKVQESMDNLECVVRERNRAYYQLEVGEDGERPVKIVPNAIGMKYKYKMSEHVLPRYYNKKWTDKVVHRYDGQAVHKFLRKLHEKNMTVKRKERHRNFNHVQHLFKRFPNMDIEKLKAEYPDVNIEKARNTQKSRGHYIPKQYQ